MVEISFSKKPRALVPSALESRLLGTRPWTKASNGWSQEAIKSGLFFNLTRVEWVDIAALVQVVLLVERALLDGISVTVALPLRHPRKSEEEWLRANPRFDPYITDRVRRRINACQFLDYLRFGQALHAEHLHEKAYLLRILADFDDSIDTKNAHVDEDDEVQFLSVDKAKRRDDHRNLYKFMFPLTWFRGCEMDTFQAMASFLSGITGVIRETRRGLEAFDARTIANVVLYELVGNVFDHSGKTSGALVAAWVRPDFQLPRPEHYTPAERPFLNWLAQKNVPVVEILVGDSGRGISDALCSKFRQAEPRRLTGVEAADIILWAFDRWSSSKEQQEHLRGTRGLYRVDRIIRKHQGLVTVRGVEQLVGLDHGGPSYENVFREGKRMASVPGTLLHCRLPVLHDAILPREPRPTRGRDFTCVTFQLGRITECGIGFDKMVALRAILKKTGHGSPTLIILIADGGDQDHKTVETTIAQLSEISHPHILVLFGLPGGMDLIENAVDSINQELERNSLSTESHRPEHFQMRDPMLVVCGPRQAFWAGVSQPLRIILDRLLVTSPLSAEEVQKLLPDKEVRAAALRNLRHIFNLVAIENDGSVSLRFSTADIFDHVGKALTNHVLNKKTGARGDGLFRTPTLKMVTRWLDVPAIFEATFGADLAAMALASRLERHDSWSKGARESQIISDSESSPIVRALARHLGMKDTVVLPRDEGLIPPRPVPIVAPKRRVIVHCDVIASGEAVRRCFLQVLRDNATPLAITCFFDARKSRSEPFEYWDVKVPVVSLSEIDILQDQLPTAGEHILNIDPVTRRVEDSDPNRPIRSFFYPIKPNELANLVEKNKALHFSHIGRRNGRHFTFYLDASGLSKEDSLVHALDAIITSWIGHDFAFKSDSKSENLEILCPEPERKPSAPASKIANTIQQHRKDVLGVRSVRREPVLGRWFFPETGLEVVACPNVLIIDWGALTGSTIMQMIRLAAQQGARRILVCVLLSQLPADEEAFLSILDSVCVLRPEIGLLLSQGEFPGFEASLSGHPRSDESVRLTRVNVQVKFLSRFPVPAYGSHECPVCQELARLAQEVYPTKLLEDFTGHQTYERLRLRTRQEVLAAVPRDFDGGEIPSGVVLSMLSFREKMLDALVSTRARYMLAETIDKLHACLAPGAGGIPVGLCELLRLLSTESFWLKRPPLCFSVMRQRLSEIAFAVAQDPSLSVADRQNAIIVLRASSKSMFADNLRELFLSVNGTLQLVQQVLHGVFTCTCRPYRQSATVLSHLFRELTELDREISEDALKVSEGVSETIESLIQRVRCESAKTNVSSLTAAEAWRRLRRAFGKNQYYRHHRIPWLARWIQPAEIESHDINTFISVKESSQNDRPVLNQATRTWFRSLSKYWRPCADFLDFTALPLLHQTRSVLEGYDARRVLGEDTVDRILSWTDEFSKSNAPVSGSEFSDLVRKISDDPERFLTRDAWDFYQSQARWFFYYLLAGDEGDRSGSRLLGFVRSCPIVGLQRIAAEVLATFQGKLPLQHMIEGINTLNNRIVVFCSVDLFRDMVVQLLENGIKHRLGDSEPLVVSFRAEEKEDDVEFTVLYKGTHDKQSGGGTGLNDLRERLQAFDATIDWGSRQEKPEYSFGVKITFRKGVQI